MLARSVLLACLAALAVACAGTEESGTPAGDLPEIDQPGFTELIEAAETPVVVNLWASWCVPCRSEAPLLVEAYERFGTEVRFVGVATEDSQADAEAFVAEFGMAFENYFDSDAEVRRWIGSAGLPTTFFVAPGGEVVSTVYGVVDERRLALEIDDLLRR